MSSVCWTVLPIYYYYKTLCSCQPRHEQTKAPPPPGSSAHPDSQTGTDTALPRSQGPQFVSLSRDPCVHQRDPEWHKVGPLWEEHFSAYCIRKHSFYRWQNIFKSASSHCICSISATHIVQISCKGYFKVKVLTIMVIILYCDEICFIGIYTIQRQGCGYNMHLQMTD